MTTHDEGADTHVDDSRVDCTELRSISSHADFLAQILDLLVDVRAEWTHDARSFESARNGAIQWLKMLSSLVSVDVAPRDLNAAPLCGQAYDYEHRHNLMIADVATEETRLMYAWNALERLFTGIALERVGDRRADSRTYNRACGLISAHLSDESSRLPHYSCVLVHLAHHIDSDPGLSAERALRDSAQKRAWRGQYSLLLSVGAAMRNIPAHGSRREAEVHDWRGIELNPDFVELAHQRIEQAVRHPSPSNRKEVS